MNRSAHSHTGLTHSDTAKYDGGGGLQRIGSEMPRHSRSGGSDMAAQRPPGSAGGVKTPSGRGKGRAARRRIKAAAAQVAAAEEPERQQAGHQPSTLAAVQPQLVARDSTARVVSWHGDWLCCGALHTRNEGCSTCGAGPPCRYYLGGSCIFRNCWYPHPPLDLPPASSELLASRGVVQLYGSSIFYSAQQAQQAPSLQQQALQAQPRAAAAAGAARSGAPPGRHVAVLVAAAPAAALPEPAAVGEDPAVAELASLMQQLRWRPAEAAARGQQAAGALPPVQAVAGQAGAGFPRATASQPPWPAGPTVPWQLPPPPPAALLHPRLPPKQRQQPSVLPSALQRALFPGTPSKDHPGRAALPAAPAPMPAAPLLLPQQVPQPACPLVTPPAQPQPLQQPLQRQQAQAASQAWPQEQAPAQPPPQKAQAAPQAEQAPVAGAGGLEPGARLSLVPESFLCPITQEVMRDPVMAADGHTYERAAIQGWLDHQAAGATGAATGAAAARSPLTNEPLPSSVLIPNRVVKAAIIEMLEAGW